MGHDEASKTRRGPRRDRRHRHKLRETWKYVPKSKMKELSKAARLYQSLPQGDSYNTVVGCWFVNDTVRPQEWKFVSQQLQTFSHLSWIHKPHKPIRKCNFSVGTSSNLNNLDPLLVLWFQTSKTSQSKISDSTSQPSSRATISVKLTLFSRATKHSGILLELLCLHNQNSFENFVCFHRTLGISPEDLGAFKADIASIYSPLSCSLTMSRNLNLILTFITRNLIGSFVIRWAFWLVSRRDDCLKHVLRKSSWIKKLINTISLHLSN